MKSGILGDRVGWLRRRLRNGHQAWGPGSVDDSLLVGSSRMDQGTAAEGTRMFFDKATGAFRAGSCTTTGWDSPGANSVAFGSNVVASGANSAAFGSGVTASGTYSLVVGQSAAAASGSGSICFGNGSNSSATASFMAGDLSNASASYAFAQGLFTNATASYTFATGSGAGAIRFGQRAHSSGSFVTTGDAQFSRFLLLKSTTDATATELTLGNQSSTYLTIGATRTMSFQINIAAHRTDVSGTAAAWPSITGGITRDATGNCRLLGSVTGASTTTLCDAGASTWSIAVTADSTNNRLAVTVTGEAAKTIRWMASVEMAEVG